MAAANLPALELGGLTLGVREGVIALISLLAIYMAFVLFRVWWLRRQRRLPAPVEAQERRAQDKLEDIPVLTEPAEDPVLPATPPDEAWEKAADGLSDQMLIRALEQEVAQLRDEVDSIRGELAALREDMLEELSHLRAAQTVSPIYGDAMQMAAAGYEPAMIAERCGIARAEAELVVALAKSQGQ